MRRIAHLSDLHFGKHDERVAEGLLADLAALQVHAVAISGDLTQRARRSQFAAARDFLARIASPLVVVPGNHDVPLFDLYRRFLEPLDRFRRFISSEPMPLLRDREVAILGINTARSFTWKDGRVSVEQIAEMERVFTSLPTDVFKVLVAHHPFHRPPQTATATVGRGERALDVLGRCGIDLILTGHLHTSHHAQVSVHRTQPGRLLLVAHAGTAISRRLREGGNGYNLIAVAEDQVIVEVRRWQRDRFATASQMSYPRPEL